MCVVLSLACLFAVYEISYGDETGKLTHEQVLSTINRQHEQFPEKVIKPILQELEKRPKVMTAMENNDLAMKTVHRTNSEIEVQPGGNSSESIKVKHAANSEFHITPRLSNPVPLPFQNSVKIGRSTMLLLSDDEENSRERLDENKIYISNLGSGILRQNGVITKRNTVYYYPRVDMVTNTRRLVSPRFFTRFGRTAVPSAGTVQVFHEQPFSAVPMNVQPIVQPHFNLPPVRLVPMLPPYCECLPHVTQPLCCFQQNGILL